MSESYDFNSELFEQMRTMHTKLAGMLNAYLDDLVAAGFSRVEAMDLVRDRQAQLFSEGVD